MIAIGIGRWRLLELQMARPLQQALVNIRLPAVQVVVLY